MDKLGKVLSYHNLDVMEEVLLDFQKEALKLRLLYEYVVCNGFAEGTISFMEEIVSFLDQRVSSLSLLFDCVSSGVDMNADVGG